MRLLYYLEKRMQEELFEPSFFYWEEQGHPFKTEAVFFLEWASAIHVRNYIDAHWLCVLLDLVIEDSSGDRMYVNPNLSSDECHFFLVRSCARSYYDKSYVDLPRLEAVVPEEYSHLVSTVEGE